MRITFTGSQVVVMRRALLRSPLKVAPKNMMQLLSPLREVVAVRRSEIMTGLGRTMSGEGNTPTPTSMGSGNLPPLRQKLHLLKSELVAATEPGRRAGSHRGNLRAVASLRRENPREHTRQTTRGLIRLVVIRDIGSHRAKT